MSRIPYPNTVGAGLRVALAVAVCCAAIPSFAGNFSVSPVRIFLEKDKTTEVVRVINEGTESVPLQVRSYDWRQETGGKDVYSATNELVYFPRILEVGAGQERIIRIGLNAPAAEAERAFRMYLEEIPVNSEASRHGVQTLVRVGIPIFRQPSDPLFAGELSGLGMDGCEARVTVANHGNVHFIVQSVNLRVLDRKGTEILSEPLKGWYLLSGSSREFSHTVDSATCARVGRLEVEVTTDKGTFEGAADAE